MRYTISDVRRRFDPATFQRGRSYAEQERVLELETVDGGQILSGKVKGQQRSNYRTQVQLRDDEQRFSSRCSCPARTNCKHAVAVLLTALDRMPQAGLSHAVSAWVDDLFALHEQTDSKGSKAPDESDNGRLRFECMVPDHPEPHVAVRVLRQGNGHVQGKAISLNGRWQRGSIRHPADRSLFNRLRAFADESPYSARLSEAGSGELFEELVRAGHCYWEDQPKPLRLDKARHAEARWTLHEDGSQSLGLHIAPQVIVLPLEPAIYVDRQQQKSGPIRTDLSPALMPILSHAPRIAPKQIEEFVRLLDARGITGVPRPLMPRTRTLAQRKPQAHLELMHIDDLVERREGFIPDIYVARLSACYDDFCFVPAQGDAQCIRRTADGLLQIQRDLAAERALLSELSEFHDVDPQSQAADQLVLTPYDGTVAWGHFLEVTLPRLKEKGWAIETRDSFDLDLLDPDEWTLETEPKGEDWFELSASFTAGGKQYNLLDLLVTLLKDSEGAERLLRENERPLIVDLGEGHMLRLPRERIQLVLHTLTELLRDKPLNRAGRLKLHRLDLARLDDWNAHWHWQVPERLQAFARSLAEQPALVQAPASFRGELRGYQSEGLTWMQNLARHGLGGILADDMGLGKTVQTLAHLACLHEQAPGHASLIVAPTSVIGNWRAEAQRFIPGFPLLVWHGKSRDAAQLPEAALVITSYATLLRDESILHRREWQLLVLDEAQTIKNPRAKISGCVRRLRARQRLCLSGTPMENHLGELWSLFDFLAPGFLGDARSFRQIYRTPIEKQHNHARAEQLSRRIQPFLLRRRKDEVARELPPKSEIIRTITLDEEQATLYESLRLSMQDKLQQALSRDGLARSQLLILDALLKLRQVCCDPRLLKLQTPVQNIPSAKLDALGNMLEELIEDGRRILLFSQFTEMLQLIETRVREMKIPYLKLTGSTPNRQELVDRFQSETIPLFLISLKAGGTGLNLTAADTVIHYDPWWNPAVENQATDRAHRIGQDKPVFVYKLICEDTVEQRIKDMQAQKQALSDQLYQGNLQSLNEDDLAWMLAANDPSD